MALLHNRISHKELREQLEQETVRRITISFYRYCSIPDPAVFRDDLFTALFALKVFGRIYVAHEGINAQVSVPETQMDAFRTYLNTIEQLQDIRLNIAVKDDGKSFFVLKIKVRDKIVADGISDETFDARRTGTYLDVNAYNTLSEQENTIIVDMRNHYEYEVGHFKNAIEIPSDTFREQLPMAKDMLTPHKDKNIIMYCTGGIRCEKASAYLLHHGFKNVFHVEGGIIHYTQKAKELGLENKFIGKNFVFDERLGEQISPDIISNCHQCGAPCNTHTNCKNDGCHLLFIQCAACAQAFDGCCSDDCKTVLQLPVEKQKELRAGKENDQKIFNKSKHRLRPRLNESQP